jgi:hypothetical protein
MGGLMDGLMDGLMGGSMGGLMDGWFAQIIIQLHGPILQTEIC